MRKPIIAAIHSMAPSALRVAKLTKWSSLGVIHDEARRRITKRVTAGMNIMRQYPSQHYELSDNSGIPGVKHADGGKVREHSCSFENPSEKRDKDCCARIGDFFETGAPFYFAGAAVRAG